MVDVEFDGGGGNIICEGCGTELPAFLDGCPYCSGDEEFDDDPQSSDAPCPSCGALIYEDSERCAICGAYVSMRVPTSKSSGSRMVTIIVIVLLVLSFLYMVTLKR